MLKKLIRTPYPYIYLLTYYGVWLIWDGLRVPFSNPLGIISSLPSLGYNPSSNVLRFLAAVGLPPLACLFYWFATTQVKGKRLLKNVWLGRAFKAGLILFPIVLACCMGIVQASTHIESNQINGQYGGPYKYSIADSFHEGETLGAAESYENPALKPYRDIVFVHGVFQDPLRTVIAFKLFGRSLGAARAFSSILTILTFLLYYVLLLVLFRRNLLKAALGMVLLALVLIPSNTVPFIYSYLVGISFPYRDIATILFLIAAIIGFRAATAKAIKKLAASSVALGFIAVADFANSIDRAFYISILAVVWVLLLAFMVPKKTFWKYVFAAFALGCLIGVPVLGLALKWDFVDFIGFLVSISAHKEFLDGIKFTRPNATISLVLLTLGAGITTMGALFISSLQATGRRSKQSWWRRSLTAIGSYVRTYHLYILLLLTALIFMRSAIGRASLDHFNYSVTWMYLLITYLVVEMVFHKKKQFFNASFITCILIVFLTGQFAIISKQTDLRHDTFPIHLKDADLFRTDHLQTADFLKKNLKGKETFVTLTSEGSWYYLADKPSPVKYPIIWFAFMPDERQGLATSLATNTNIKYVVTNNNWTSDIDFVPNDQRFPELYKVLHSLYIPSYGFGQQTVWQRKADAGPIKSLY